MVQADSSTARMKYRQVLSRYWAANTNVFEATEGGTAGLMAAIFTGLVAWLILSRHATSLRSFELYLRVWPAAVARCCVWFRVGSH